jgi:hypothetical protein
MLLSLNAQGNPLQQDQSKEPHAEHQHQQPTLDGHLWESLSTNSLDFPTTTAVDIFDKKKGSRKRRKSHTKTALFLSGSNGEAQAWLGSCDQGKYLLNQKNSKELIERCT